MVVGRGISSSSLHITRPSLTAASLLGLADKLDRARLEKMYEGAEQRLKQTTHVAYEPRLEAPKCVPPPNAMSSCVGSIS